MKMETSDLIRFAFKMINVGYGICDSCGDIVDGEADGWHDSEEYGEGNVCQDCCDIATTTRRIKRW